MASRDLYAVLGVARSASAEEIKAAYRKLVRKLHPDVNKASDAQQRFTEVQNAYDILADAQKRKAYDQYGEAGVSGPTPNGSGSAGAHRWGGPGRSGASTEFDPEELSSIFETFFSGQPGFGGPGARSGQAGARGSRARGAGRAEAARSVEHPLEVDFLTAAKGGTESLRVTEGGKSRTIDVRIPAGICDGAQLRVKGGAGAEDLILKIRVGAHPLFRRADGAEAGKSLDLLIELPLTLAEAVLGASVSVPTLDGSLEMKVPGGTDSGRKFRLKGKGIAPESGPPGDLYAVAKIVVPDAAKLSEAEREMLKQLSDRGGSPRTGAVWGAK